MSSRRRSPLGDASAAAQGVMVAVLASLPLMSVCRWWHSHRTGFRMEVDELTLMARLAKRTLAFKQRSTCSSSDPHTPEPACMLPYDKNPFPARRVLHIYTWMAASES